MGYADKILQAATVTRPDGTQDVNDKYLAQLVTSADKNITDLEQDANDQLAKQRMAAMKLRIDLDASIRKLVANLHNTAGRERGEIITSAQRDMANIRDNYIKLVSENPAVIGSVTTKTEQAVVNAGDTPEARVNGWDTLMGDMNDLGVVSVGNPEVLALYRWAEKRLGDPEDPSFPEGEIKRRALEFKRIAMDAETQKAVAARKDLDGQLGQLTSSITNLTGQSDLQKAIGESVNQLQQLGQNAASLYPPPVANQAAELQLFLSNSAGYNEMVATRDRAIAALFGSASKQSMSDREKLARLAANPHFAQWAKSNGYNIGTIQFNADGTPNIDSYVPNRDIIRAAYTYNWQRNHKPEQLIRDYDTGRWVELTVKEGAEKAAITDSRYQTLLLPPGTPSEAAQTPGRDSAASPTGAQKAGDRSEARQAQLYAYTTDENGQRVYLDGDQLDAVAGATLKTDADPIAFTHDNLPYVYDPKTQTLYEGVQKDPNDPKSAVWQKSDKKLEDVGQSAENYEGSLAVVKRGDQWVPAPSDAIEGQSINNVLPTEAVDASTGQPAGTLARSLDSSKLKAGLSRAGVTVTNEPPPTPEFKTYGKEIRMHATDPTGSIRIRTGSGEQLYTKDQIARVETTFQRADTSLPLTVSSLVGRHDQRLAQKLRDEDPWRKRLSLRERARWTGYPLDLQEQPDQDRIDMARPKMTEAESDARPDRQNQNPPLPPTTYDPRAVLSADRMAVPPVGEEAATVRSAAGDVEIPSIKPAVSAAELRQAANKPPAAEQPPAPLPAYKPPTAAPEAAKRIEMPRAMPASPPPAAASAPADEVSLKPSQPVFDQPPVAAKPKPADVELKPSVPVFESAAQPAASVDLKPSTPVFDTPAVDASVKAASAPPQLSTKRDRAERGEDPENPEKLPTTPRRRAFQRLLGY